MKLFHKSWVFLMAMGLVIGLALQPGGVLAGDLTVDTKTTVTGTEEILFNDDLTFSNDGAEGDPDGTLEALGSRESDLQELLGCEGLPDVDDFSWEELLICMMTWFGLF